MSEPSRRPASFWHRRPPRAVTFGVLVVSGAACTAWGAAGHAFLDPPNAVVVRPGQVLALGIAQLVLVAAALVESAIRARAER